MDFALAYCLSFLFFRHISMIAASRLVLCIQASRLFFVSSFDMRTFVMEKRGKKALFSFFTVCHTNRPLCFFCMTTMLLENCLPYVYLIDSKSKGNLIMIIRDSLEIDSKL